MKAPKCKSCGKEEWRHVCGGDPAIKALVEKRMNEMMEKPETKAAIDKLAQQLFVEPTSTQSDDLLSPKAKTDRKEYLKLKARERRARQRAERLAAGKNDG